MTPEEKAVAEQLAEAGYSITAEDLEKTKAVHGVPSRPTVAAASTETVVGFRPSGLVLPAEGEAVALSVTEDDVLLENP